MAEAAPVYRVHWDVAMPDVRRLKARAMKDGSAARMRLSAALRELDRELSRSPLLWGEPKNLLKSVGWIICIGFSHRFRVIYGVDEQRRDVYMRAMLDHDD